MTKNYLVTGASGLLGHVLVPHLAERGFHVCAVSHSHALPQASSHVTGVRCDLRNTSDLSALLEKTSPDVIIHAAGLTSVDQCETDPVQAFLLNTAIPETLAIWCSAHQKKYVFISSDHVTGGHKALFTEDDPISPVNVYAESKARAEHAVMEACPQAQILRTNFFGKGPDWRKSLTDWLWDKASVSETIPAFTDSYFSPLSVHYLSQAITDLSLTSESGIFHAGGSERLSKHEFALKFVEFFGFDRALVKPSLTADAHLSAPRPADMSMSVQKIESVLGRSMPTIQQSFESIKDDYKKGISL